MHAQQQPRRARTAQAIGSFLTRRVLACGLVGGGIVAPAAAQAELQPPFPVRHQLVGSWLVAYGFQAFGVPIPILLSFGRDGVMLETDSPAPTPLGSLGVLIVSKWHGAWVPKGEPVGLPVSYVDLPARRHHPIRDQGDERDSHNQHRRHAIAGGALDAGFTAADGQRL